MTPEERKRRADEFYRQMYCEPRFPDNKEVTYFREIISAIDRRDFTEARELKSRYKEIYKQDPPSFCEMDRIVTEATP